MGFERKGEEGGIRVFLDIPFQEVRQHDEIVFCLEGRMLFCLDRL